MIGRRKDTENGRSQAEEVGFEKSRVAWASLIHNRWQWARDVVLRQRAIQRIVLIDTDTTSAIV